MEAKLLGNDTMAGDKFGISVGISESYAVVASLREGTLTIPVTFCTNLFLDELFWGHHTASAFARLELIGIQVLLE